MANRWLVIGIFGGLEALMFVAWLIHKVARKMKAI
jgi:hypothetical protein